MRRCAGSAVSPPMRVSSTFTPGAIRCVFDDAGAAAHAIPAVATTARAAFSTARGNLVDAAESIMRFLSGSFASAVRTPPSPRPPMENATWTIGACSEPAVRTLVEGLGVSPTTASVLVRRGHDDPAAARAFLDGALPGHDPFALGDMPA